MSEERSERQAHRVERVTGQALPDRQPLDRSRSPRVSRRRFWQGIALAVFLGLFVSAGFFILFQPTHAASFEDLGATLGLGSKDLVATIITFVQWVLGVLSLIVVVILLYGGFVWMTAAGNEEKIAKAKRIIRNGIIGLIIVLISWAIVFFVAKVLSNSTGGGGPVQCTAGEVNGCFTCDNTGAWVWNGTCGFPGPQYYVQSKDPSDQATNIPLCAAVQAAFGGLSTPPLDANDLDGTTVNATNVVIQKRAGAAVAGSFGTNANAFSFTHPTDLDVNSIYDVTVTSNVKSKYGTGSRPETWSFTTGSTTDPDPPNVTSWYPRGNQVCLSPAISATFNESMLLTSMNLSNITLSPADAQIVNLSVTPTQFIAYTDQPLKPNTTYTITLSADTTNGFRDACNNALDCGNTPNTCTSNGTAQGAPADNFVWTFTTKNTTDTSCEPRIDSIAPSAAYYTTANADEITINGSNFGPSDRVQFTPGYSATVQNGANSLCFSNAAAPNNFKPQQASSVACISSWQDDQIKVKTPAGPLGSPPTGASDGPVVVRVGVKQSNASTPYTVASPHINYVSPNSGGAGQYVTVVGKNFGNTVGEVWFRRDDGTEFRGDAPPASCGAQTWTDTQIIIKVPNGFTVNDLTRVQVKNTNGRPNGNDRSNLVDFRITNVVGPGLCSLSLACVNDPSANVAITMNGERFGVSRGSSVANFMKLTPPNTNYQPGSYTGWNDTLVSTFVPTGVPQDSYHVSVTVNGTASNPLNFQVPCGGIPQVVSDASCAPASGSPSPSPLPSDTPNACRNAAIRVLFSTDMDDATIANVNNYELRKCGTKLAFSSFNNAECDRPGVPGNPVGLNNPSVANYLNPTRDGATIQPIPVMLDQNTWYRMTVKRTVKSAAGVTMAQDFVWHFVTQDSVGPCAIDTITVTPPSATNTHPSSTVFRAVPSAIGCQALVGNSYTWNWTSSNAAVAVPNPAGPGDTTSYDSQGAEGQTTVTARVPAENKAGNATLSITLDYCQRNSDCVKAGCPNATCDAALSRCNPTVESVAPPAGPVGTTVTINGCYFGPSRGTRGKVEFENTEAINVCSAGGWTDSQITVAVPAGLANGTAAKLYVTADDLRTNRNNQALASIPTFTYSAQCCANAACTAFTAVPASGPPGVCAISPNLQSQGRAVTLTGEKLPTGAGPDQVEFGGGSLASRPFSTSTSTQITTNVPAGAVTGNVYVKAWNGSAYCYSNPKLLTVACQNPGLGSPDCPVAGNTCCTGNPLSCQVDANCNVGAPGDQCRISGYVPCSTGAGVVTDPNNFNCVSETGYTGNPPPAAGGLDCRVCCTPNQRNSVSPMQAGLKCVVNQSPAITTCTGAARGLYCGCSRDDQCGISASNGCNNGNPRCCNSRPTFSVRPGNTATGVCRNAAIVVTFSRAMQDASIVVSNPAQTTDTVRVTNTSTNTLVTLSKQLNSNILTLNRVDGGGLFDPNRQYRIDYTGDPDINDGNPQGILSNDGIGLNGNYSSVFTTGGTVCQPDHLRVGVTGPTLLDIAYSDDTDLTLYNAYRIFTSSLDNKDPNDSDAPDSLSHTAGNNREAFVSVVDRTGALIAVNGSDFSFTESNQPQDTLVLDPFVWGGPDPSARWVTAKNVEGVENVHITYNGSTPLSTDVSFRSFFCTKPWPAAPNPFPYSDGDYHFTLQYCRDNGNLPRLELPAVVNSPGAVAGNNVDQLLREYFFYVLDDTGARTGDAIGVRVMENELRLSPQKWYQRQFGRAPSAAVTKVDGYEAFTEGRTTYVAGTNLANNGTLYTQIFLLSYNDGAKPETQAIVGELLKYWFLNTNLSSNNKLAVTHDTKRMADLRDVAFSLVDYKKANGDYPKLSSGSYLAALSTSAWPSWSQTLGSALRITPPLDVLNTFSPACTAPYDSKTCWNETNKQFQCGASSHVYQYKYEGATAAALFANLEYIGQGAWTNYNLDPCSGYAGSSCRCYNFRWPDDDFETLVSSFAQAASTDTAKPTVAIAAPANGATVSGNSVAVTATASDNVGVTRVEFYLDSALQFTDTTNSYSWTWDSTRTLNGGHAIVARAFDAAGNSNDASINVTVNNPLSDTTPPTVSITTPANNATLTANTVTISANAADSGGIKEVAFYANTTLLGTPDTTSPYSVAWDTTSFQNGPYTLIAVAFDNAGNSAVSRITVTLNRSLAADTTPPTVSITAPSPGSTLSGTVSVDATASDPESGVTQVQFFLDGVAQLTDTTAPYSWSWNTTTATNGNHTLRADARNGAGLTTQSSDVTVTVNNGGGGDSTPPTTPVVIDDGQFQTSTSSLHATWSAGDPESGIAGYEYSIGTSAGSTNVVNWTSSFTQTSVTHSGLTLTSGTTYFFNVRATNGAGLVSALGSSDGITVDNTPPTVSVTTPTAGATVSGNTTISATATDGGSGMFQVQFIVDLTVIGMGSSVTPPTWSITWDTTSFSNGSHTIRAIATDQLGNSATSAGVTVNVNNIAPDTTPPTTPVVTDDGQWQTSTITLHATWSASDPESAITKYEYSVGTSAGATDVLGWTTPSPATATDVTYTGLSLANGITYFVNVRATSGGGVSPVGSSDGITVDNQPPAITVTAPAANSFVNGTVNISYTANDGTGSGVAFVRPGLSYVDPVSGLTIFETIGPDDTTSPYSATWPTAGRDESIVYTIRGYACDVLGNCATGTQGGIRVDNTAPVSVSLSANPNPVQTNDWTTITATANDGSGSGVASGSAKLECWEGAAILWTDAAPQDGLTCPYNPTTVGNHTITGKVWDALGNGPTQSTVVVSAQDCVPSCNPVTQKCCYGACIAIGNICLVPV